MVKISIPSSNKEIDKNANRMEFNVEAIIFDKDGTLLSHDHFVPIMQKRIELLLAQFKLSAPDQDKLTRILGLDPATNEIIQHGTMFIARADTQLLVELFLTELGFRGPKMRAQVAEIFEQADEQVNLENHLRPFPGIPELLAKLKQNGVKIAIATHDSTSAAIRQLTVAKLIENIDLVIGLDYSENILHKPSPSMFLTACTKFDISPGSAAVVGDSKNDVLMGVRGGAGVSVAVLSGEHEASDFLEFDTIIDSVSDIDIID